MAREFKLLFLLLFVVAFNGQTASPSSVTTRVSDGVSTTSPAPTTGAAGASTTPSPAPTTGAAGASTTPSSAPTTGAAGASTTPSPAPTTSAAGASTTPSPAPTTGAAGASTTPSSAPTTGSGGASSTPSPAPTTGSGGTSSTPSPAPTTGSDGTSTTPSPAPTTGSGGVSTTTPLPATTKPLDPCDSKPCGGGSTCEPRANQEFVCLCLAGDYYNNISKICESSKVFPGQLVLKMDYNEEMSDKTSTVFQTESKKITDALDEIYKDSEGYVKSTVLELLSATASKVWSRSKESVTASVEIIFGTIATIESSKVNELIEDASKCTDDCLLGNAQFKETNLCKRDACDEYTAKCLYENGLFNCTCNENHIPTDFTNRICLACPSGKKASGSKCIDCPYGYSGFNCKESWQLTLTIVGPILGGLLLITLILLPVVACKSSKKSSRKSKDVDIAEPYISHSPAKAPLANSSLANNQAPSVNNGSANVLGSFSNAGAPRIPRVTSSWDRRTNLEMTPSSSQQNLISAGRNTRLYEDMDDMNSNTYAQARPPSSLYAQAQPPSSLYAQARPSSSLYAQDRPQSSPYAQARPQNNPYTQNRPQTNPYASSQGQTNPYYTHDDGRRYN